MLLPSMQELYEHAPVGYITTDDTHTIIAINHTGLQMLAYEKEHVLYSLFMRFVLPEDQDIYSFHMQQAHALTEVQGCDVRLLRADGSTFIAHLHTHLYIDDETQRQEYRTVFFDITSRARAEQTMRHSYAELQSYAQEHSADLKHMNELLRQEIAERQHIEVALRESENLFRVALHNSPTFVFTQNRDLEYTWVYNSRSDFSNDSVIGKTDAEIMPPEDAERLTALKRRVLETGVGMHETIRITERGRSEWYDTKYEPLFDAEGHVVGLSGLSTNVTAHRRLIVQQQILASISTELAGTSSDKAALDRVAQLLVPDLGDSCIISVLDADGILRAQSIIHVDPARQASLQQM
ncbi:MAG: PAS domain-containing protein, partial [Chloroflexaceae bacterium]|nr:PAS domain-containing protein [Chloroflexaceae bacterium]